MKSCTCIFCSRFCWLRAICCWTRSRGVVSLEELGVDALELYADDALNGRGSAIAKLCSGSFGTLGAGAAAGLSG